MDLLDADQYRCGDVLRFPIGNQAELLYSKDRKSTKILPAQVAEYLARCRTFQTIENHAQILLKELSLGEMSLESLKSQLKELVNDGFLISTRDLIKKCEGLQNPHNTLTSISAICFPTRNRVKSLQRSITSFIQNTQKYGRKVDFIVADDSENPDIRRQYKEMLKSLRTQFGVRIFYAGLEEKERFAHRLISQNLPPDVVNFALFDMEKTGFSPGANRNALLFETAGHPILMTDDDTVCRLSNAPGSGKTLTFLSGQDPTEYCFYPDTATMLKSVPFVDKDILSIHEQMLGKELWDCIPEFGPHVNFDRSSPSFLRKILPSNGKILAAKTGIIGDLGSGSPSALLSLEGESRRRFLRSESEYREAIASRLVLRKASFPIITDGSFCMTTSISLDHRAFLPPFMPIHRNSDGIFGVTLRINHENGYFAHLPWAILHLPLEETRSFLLDDIWNTPSVDFKIDEIIIQSMKLFNFEHGPKNKEEILKVLGENLMALGSVHVTDFAEAILLRMLRLRKAYIDHLENLLKKHGASPNYWARDVKRHLDKIRITLAKGNDMTLFPDLSCEPSPTNVWRTRQHLVQMFGQLLIQWPGMIESAKTLRSEGKGIAELV
jgi:hypothetical protein